jgi:hypothetical protein
VTQTKQPPPNPARFKFADVQVFPAVRIAPTGWQQRHETVADEGSRFFIELMATRSNQS